MSINTKPRGRPKGSTGYITLKQKSELQSKHKKLVKEVFKLLQKFLKVKKKVTQYHENTKELPSWVLRHLDNPDQITPRTKEWFEYAINQDKIGRAHKRKDVQDKYLNKTTNNPTISNQDEQPENAVAYFSGTDIKYYTKNNHVD